jgi:hypothetical protein
MRLFFDSLWREEYKSRIPLYEVLERVSPRLHDGPAAPAQTASADGAAGEQPAPVADPVLERWDDKQLAEYLHMRYEKHARHQGETTHPPTNVAFDALPDARKRTLLLLARDVQALLTRVKYEGFVKGKEQAFCIAERDSLNEAPSQETL